MCILCWQRVETRDSKKCWSRMFATVFGKTESQLSDGFGNTEEDNNWSRKLDVFKLNIVT